MKEGAAQMTKPDRLRPRVFPVLMVGFRVSGVFWLGGRALAIFLVSFHKLHVPKPHRCLPVIYTRFRIRRTERVADLHFQA